MRKTIAVAVVFLMGLNGCAAAPRPSATPSSPPPTSSPAASPAPTPSPGLTPSPAPTASAPTSAPTSTLVTSERFGYTIEMPAGWRYQAATTDWPAHTYPAAGATYTDNFEPIGAPFPALDISTQQLPDDQTPTEFLADLDAVTASIGYEIAEDGEIVVDGVTGRLQLQIIDVESIWEVILFHDGRVYAIYWVGLASQRETDEPLFRHVMDTFAFPIAG